MQITRKINLNVRKTVERSVAGSDEFHFFVDELTDNGFMPTYAGMADEKYTYDEMEDDFFTFLERKAAQDGIYIRLVFANSIDSSGSEASFNLEYAGKSETFRISELDDIMLFEFSDYGIRVKGGCVTFGCTVEGRCGHTPYFAEFGSVRGNVKYLSVENPLNRRIISIMEEMIIMDD